VLEVYATLEMVGGGVDHIRSGPGLRGGGDVSRTDGVRRSRSLGTRLKMRRTVTNSTTELAPDPIYTLGMDQVLNLLDGRLSKLAVLSWRIHKLEIVICSFILHRFARYVYMYYKSCFLRIYHDSGAVDRWNVCQLSSNRRKDGVMIGRCARFKARLISQ
jgi:hypothetical protein